MLGVQKKNPCHFRDRDSALEPVAGTRSDILLHNNASLNPSEVVNLNRSVGICLQSRLRCKLGLAEPKAKVDD
jgi:hypothetical protein